MINFISSFFYLIITYEEMRTNENEHNGYGFDEEERNSESNTHVRMNQESREHRTRMSDPLTNYRYLYESTFEFSDLGDSKYDYDITVIKHDYSDGYPSG